MENHPIPQDVTGFKFKLIGSITVKQFLYLLAAGILATLTFVLPFPFVIKIPFMVLFSLIGVVFAFIPVDGRPMDTMLLNFAKALPAENKYVFHKKGAHIPALDLLTMPTHQQATKQLEKIDEKTKAKREYLQKTLHKHYIPDEEKTADVNTILAAFQDPSQIKAEPSTTAVPEIEKAEQTPKATKPVIPQAIPEIKQEIQDVNKEARAEEEIETIQEQIQEVQKEEVKEGKTDNLEKKIKELQAQLSMLLAEKDVLLKKVTTHEEKTPKVQYSPHPPSENVKSIGSQNQFQAGFPTLPDVPNVIMGIIKDPRGKVLPNILVEVHDTNDIPVRAFKTNALGQFASATPLLNGAYKVTFEDPQKKNEFDTIEIVMKGEIFQPLEVTSMDQREKLRQELFGVTSSTVLATPNSVSA